MTKFQSMDSELQAFLERAQNIKESYTSDPKDISRAAENYANEIQDLSTGRKNYTFDPREDNVTVESVNRPPYGVRSENQYQNILQGNSSSIPMGMKLNVNVQQPRDDQPKKSETIKEQSKKLWHCKNNAIEPGIYGNFEIVTGGGGFRKLKYDGMLYSVNRITANQNKVYWRCANRKCNGRVTTQNYEIVGATDHSREAHSGEGGGYSAKTIKQLQNNVPSREASPRASADMTVLSNKTTGRGQIPSPAPSGRGITQPSVHAPNPYSPLLPHHLNTRGTPTPPRNIPRDPEAQGQGHEQGQSLVDLSIDRFGSNLHNPILQDKYDRYSIKDNTTTNQDKRKSRTPPKRKGPWSSKVPPLPIHEAFPFSTLYRPKDDGLIAREGRADPRRVPSSAAPEEMPKDLRSDKTRRNHTERQCK